MTFRCTLKPHVYICVSKHQRKTGMYSEVSFSELLVTQMLHIAPLTFPLMCELEANFSSVLLLLSCVYTS